MRKTQGLFSLCKMKQEKVDIDYGRPNAWLTYSDADMQDLETVAKKYRHFLNVGKTERECITQIVKEAEEAGYVSLEER